MTTPYDQEFFRNMDDWGTNSAKVVVPEILSLLSPHSVIDVGGGTGGWAAQFLHLGVSECQCIDGDYVDKKSLRVPQESFQNVDLSKPFNLGRRFGLAVCLEVAEHLDSGVADDFIASLTLHSDAILFSAAVPHQGGTHHVNEQWPNYWAAKFKNAGYRCFDCIRWRVWHVEGVAWWYKQNTLMYLNDNAVAALDPVSKLRTTEVENPVSVVHPEAYLGVARSLEGLQTLSDVPRLPWVARAIVKSAKASLHHHASKAIRPSL